MYSNSKHVALLSRKLTQTQSW